MSVDVIEHQLTLLCLGFLSAVKKIYSTGNAYNLYLFGFHLELFMTNEKVT